MDVGLEPVPQSQLGDAPAILQVIDQPQEVPPHVVRYGLGMGGDDRADEDPAEARSRLDREPRPAERHSPGGCHPPRVPHLELGQQHGRRLEDGR